MSEGQLLLRVLCLDVNLADRALEQADLGAVMAGLDDNSFFSDADDLADDAADGGDLITYTQLISHVLKLFLLLVFGTNKEEVEYYDKNNEHQNIRKVAHST